MAVALLGAGITVHAQTSAKDSMRVVNLQEVQVVWLSCNSWGVD